VGRWLSATATWLPTESRHRSLDTGERIRWRENHFYRIVDGKINEPWPAGDRPSIVDQTQPEELTVPIYQTAHYQVRLDAVDRVKTAIEEFVR
jgi:hypothetical protein